MAQRMALLCVDAQVDFVEPGGRLYARGAESLKRNLARLVGAASAHGIPLVSCVDAHAADDPEFQDWPPHAVLGTPGQAKIRETLRGDEVVVPNAERGEPLPDPRRTHVVLEKQTFSLFTNRWAERVLEATGAEEVHVFGVVTEVCVKEAVLGLLERGYRVKVIEDAIWPIDPAGGERALREMVARGASRTTVDDTLAEAQAAVPVERATR